jgi:hypothetical protein
MNQINTALNKKNAPPLEQVKAIQYSATRNIIAITSDNVRAEDMLRHEDAFSEAFFQNCSLQPDVKWLKLIVHMVPCCNLHSNPLTIQQVLDNLTFSNGPMQLAANLRWLNCNGLGGKIHLSLVLSFDNLEEYLKWKNSTIIFAGGLCKTGTFEDCPLMLQCARCWSFSHLTRACKTAKPTCCMCAGPHSQADHPCRGAKDGCDGRMSEDKNKACDHGGELEGMLLCTNCRGAHYPNDPHCSKRPIAQSLKQG